MKVKTINNIITAKFLRWANTITDDKVKAAVMSNSIITGGAIVSLLLYLRNR